MEPDEQDAMSLRIWEELTSPRRPFSLDRETVLELIQNHGMPTLAKWFVEWMNAEDRRIELKISRQRKQQESLKKPYAPGLSALLTACLYTPSDDSKKITIADAFVKVVRDGGPDALRDMANLLELMRRPIPMDTRPGEMLATFGLYLQNGILISQADLLKEYADTKVGRGDADARTLMRKIGLGGLPESTSPQLEKLLLRIKTRIWQHNQKTTQ